MRIVPRLYIFGDDEVDEYMDWWSGIRMFTEPPTLPDPINKPTYVSSLELDRSIEDAINRFWNLVFWDLPPYQGSAEHSASHSMSEVQQDGPSGGHLEKMTRQRDSSA